MKRLKMKRPSLPQCYPYPAELHLPITGGVRVAVLAGVGALGALQVRRDVAQVGGGKGGHKGTLHVEGGGEGAKQTVIAFFGGWRRPGLPAGRSKRKLLGSVVMFRF